jgi:hypothetical protein
MLEQAGWEGRWIDSYKNRTLIGYWDDNIEKDLPPKQQALLDSGKKPVHSARKNLGFLMHRTRNKLQVFGAATRVE